MNARKAIEHGIAACLLLWSTETVLPQDAGRVIEERVEIQVCGGARRDRADEPAERFLEVWRTVTFKGFPNEPMKRVLELKLPWGAASGAAPGAATP